MYQSRIKTSFKRIVIIIFKRNESYNSVLDGVIRENWTETSSMRYEY